MYVCKQGTMFRIGLDRNVIYGGDLNLRDKELVEVGGLPASTRYTTLLQPVTWIRNNCIRVRIHKKIIIRLQVNK